MIINLITFIVLFALMLGLGWLTWRAWHARHALVRWPGVVLGSLATLLIGLVTAIGGVGFARLYLAQPPPAPDLQAAGTPEQIARGEHLARVFCAECHGTDYQLPLSGGWDLSAGTGLPLGTIVAANLTPGGRISGWSDGEIIRVLRSGRAADGQPLVAMRSGSTFYRNFSDEDALALVAYLRSQPAVPTEIPREQPSWLALMFVAAGLLPNPPAGPVTGPVVAPPKAATAEYGQYVVDVSGCRDCHGADLTGGPGGIIPAGPNLTAIVPQWTVDEFMMTLRTGVDPSGHELSADMPWRGFGQMDDIELNAIYTYITAQLAAGAAE